jgi:hypothetical protein
MVYFFGSACLAASLPMIGCEATGDEQRLIHRQLQALSGCASAVFCDVARFPPPHRPRVDILRTRDDLGTTGSRHQSVRPGRMC